jgi:hypothetical protein
VFLIGRELLDASPAEVRMLRRFPQPVRVGDLIGLPVIDENHRAIGWFGWEARAVAVPIEVVGIQGRELASLGMPRGGYVTAPAWRQTDETAISDDESVKIALCKL